MAIDLSRFQATFFEESREGLDAMESALLGLESGNADAEAIHTVFRAAHSIKGGAATFGFTRVTETTHLLETLLDQMRSGKRAIEPDAMEALLSSVDILRGLLAAARDQTEVDELAVQGLVAELERLLAIDPSASVAAAKKPVDTAPASSGYRIAFAPQPHLFMTGNDPLRILRELDRLGKLTSTAKLDGLPAFDAMDPTQAYLAWDLALEGAIRKEDVTEAFAWVEDDCALSIEPMSAAPFAKQVEEKCDPAPEAAQLRRATDKPDAKIGASDASGADSSIRVNVAKVDALINLVGELVITQAMLKQAGSTLDPAIYEKLLAGLATLERNTRDLQEAVISVRMLPVDFVFSRFPRLVRDLGSRLGKKVRLKTTGEGTELDKGVIEKIVDPLVHLVRNSIDHGLEAPDVRRAAGKDETGTVTLSASHQGGHIVIEVGDDGKGLDRARIVKKAQDSGLAAHEGMSDAEVYNLIFHPGLSTAEKITDVSGRGVGMDVVKKNIVALGGDVQIDSKPGQGTRVIVRLPLTLAILDGMSVAVGGETFILPLGFVVESLQPKQDDVRTVQGDGRVLRVRGDYLPLVDMAHLFNATKVPDAGPPLAVVVESDGKRLALEIDELLGQQQIVVKNLETNYRRVHGVSGATILGDGKVALIVDVSGIARSMARAA